jgi:hypothetical protein
VPDVFDFVRHIQPILDEHCVSCHTYEKRDGGVILTGDRGVSFSHGYWTLFATRQIADGRNAYGNNAPRTIGSSASDLMDKLTANHHGVEVSDRERTTVRLWIETGAPFAGTYAALGTEDLPLGRTLGAVRPVLARRCASCHAVPGTPGPAGRVPLPAEPQHGPNYQRLVRDNDPVARLGLAILFNFTRPEKSPLLLGPLAEAAGGYGSCRPLGSEKAAEAIFADTTDRDYQVILAAVRATKETVDRQTRFHMAGFRPNRHYVREMQRYGILPPSFDSERDPVDVYALDRAYWRSLWYTPATP